MKSSEPKIKELFLSIGKALLEVKPDMTIERRRVFTLEEFEAVVDRCKLQGELEGLETAAFLVFRSRGTDTKTVNKLQDDILALRDQLRKEGDAKMLPLELTKEKLTSPEPDTASGVVCSKCKGAGMIMVRNEGLHNVIVCEVCHGTGQTDRKGGGG